MLRFVFTAIFFALSLFLFSVCSSAESKPVLYLASWQFDISWECSTGVQLFLAGGRAGMRARITEVTIPQYPSLEEGWPQGMTILAGRMVKDSFVPDQEMLERMHLARLIWTWDFADDSIAHAKGEMSHLQREYGLCYGFSLDVPVEYAGQRIYLQVTFDTPEIGHLKCLRPLDVVSPCDEKARQIMQGSFLLEANFRGQHERAVQIADSLIVLGWRDLIGLDRATTSAIIINRPADALRFLDLNFKANGRIETPTEGEVVNEKFRQDQRHLYQQFRLQLLEKIRNQEQQQQQK